MKMWPDIGFTSFKVNTLEHLIDRFKELYAEADTHISDNTYIYLCIDAGSSLFSDAVDEALTADAALAALVSNIQGPRRYAAAGDLISRSGLSGWWLLENATLVQGAGYKVDSDFCRMQANEVNDLLAKIPAFVSALDLVIPDDVVPDTYIQVTYRKAWMQHLLKQIEDELRTRNN